MSENLGSRSKLRSTIQTAIDDSIVEQFEKKKLPLSAVDWISTEQVTDSILDAIELGFTQNLRIAQIPLESIANASLEQQTSEEGE